jgi:large subunit ribosomal protein L47
LQEAVGQAANPTGGIWAAFFDKPVQEGEASTTGREWLAADLRKKSWDDLHKLWYVLLKERNMLETELSAAQKALDRARTVTLAVRKRKVRKSMARIKLVLTERAVVQPDAEVSKAMKRMINAQ